MRIQRELARLAAQYAAHDELWAAHRDPEAFERRYVSLRRDDRFDVWAIFWLPGSDTGWHDHDVSSGAVQVVEGTLEEHVLCVRGPDRSRLVERGNGWSFGPDHIHRLTCAAARATSIHVYSPTLWRLGQYDLRSGGLLRRISVSYAEELRPLEAACPASG